MASGLGSGAVPWSWQSLRQPPTPALPCLTSGRSCCLPYVRIEELTFAFFLQAITVLLNANEAILGPTGGSCLQDPYDGPTSEETKKEFKGLQQL